MTRRRPRAPLVAASGCALLVALLGVAGCSGPGEGPPRAAEPTTGATSSVNAPATSTGGGDRQRLAALDALLDRRERAVLAGDRPAFAQTVADPASESGRRQLDAFDTAVALGADRVGHDPLPTRPGDAVAPAEAADPTPVTVTYRVAGTDTADRRATIAYAVVEVDGEWLVADESPTGPGASVPWVALPGAHVERSDHAVVAGTVDPSSVRAHAAVTERVRDELAQAWPGIPDTVLVLAPATADEADRLLGRQPGGAAVAATTEGPLGPDGRATGDVVVLDPDAFARLTPVGQEVVLAHELAHVAVRAQVAGRQEAWLAEGYASHIGYARAGQDVETLAEPLLDAVRAGSAPRELPGTAEVDPARGGIEVAYLAAWQAIELIADQHGEDALRRVVVEASSTGTDADVRAATDSALRSVLGVSRAGLTREWQARLRDLAS